MGRVKLKLKTVESHTGRIVTYSKRKNALLKKANELAVLCEIDVMLLMFSPTGKIALQMGNANKFYQIIGRFASTSAEERARSKMEVFETLKKSYKNSDHEVQAKYFSGTRSRSVEELNLLQEQLADTQQRLSDWRNPDKIEDIELLGKMEYYLKGLFDQIKSQKNLINLALNVGAELRSPGGECSYIASTSNQIALVKREPLMETLTAGYLSRLENKVIDNSKDHTNNLRQTELLRNELAALQSEAWRNEFARSEFLINAYKEADTHNNMKEETSTYRYSESDYLRNKNELFIADNSRVPLQQQNPFPQQNFVPLQQQNVVPPQQQNGVHLEQQNPCIQQNMDYSFDEGNLAAPSLNCDSILEWSGPFGGLDFALPDTQQPLSIDDYM